jgi:hypothetical protein
VQGGTHRAWICAEIDGVGDQQKRQERANDPPRVMSAQIFTMPRPLIQPMRPQVSWMAS